MAFVFNEKETLDLLGRLVNIASPSGYTQKIMGFMGSLLKDLNISYKMTNKGAIIVTYDATKNPVVLNIDEEKALNWLNKGAVPSDTVKNLLKEAGVMKTYAEQKSSKSY